MTAAHPRILALRASRPASLALLALLLTSPSACTKRQDPGVRADTTAHSAAPTATASTRTTSAALASASASAAPSTSASALADGACPTDMAAIPGGKLIPLDDGSKELRKGDPRTPADIPKPSFVAPFCMDKNEVTVARYRKCVDAGACEEPQAYEKHREPLCNWKHPDPSHDTHPVNCLPDREAAIAFCAFDGGKAIPTDAQWERAARGGPHLWKWPWGDSRPTQDQANLGGTKYCSSELHVTMCGGSLPGYGTGHFDGTAPVGSLPKGDNPWGVHDLIGNVGEITHGEVDHGFGPGGSTGPAMRGGCFGDTYWPAVELDIDLEILAQDARAGIRCVKVR